jgi:uncharacterized protein (DUF885 family)
VERGKVRTLSASCSGTSSQSIAAAGSYRTACKILGGGIRLFVPRKIFRAFIEFVIPTQPYPSQGKYSMKIALSLIVTALAVPAWASPGFDTWAEGVAAQRMRANPVRATLFQYFGGEEQAALDGRFASISKSAILADVAREREALAALREFDPKTLTPVQKVSAQVIGWSLEQDIVQAAYLDDDFVFNQMSGLQADPINFMSQQQPLRNARDVESYLERLAGLASLMDQGIARARSAEVAGVLMPRFITAKTISQFEQFLAPAAARNVLVTTMDERMAQIPGLSAEHREAVRTKAEKIVADAVLPAWRRGLALMQAQLPHTNDNAGVWRLKGGDHYYAARLREMTTTDYTPAEIHAIGLAQVARIEGEMDGLLKQLGYAEGSVKDRYARMDADRQPKTGDPRLELLSRYTSILRDAEARAKLVFDVQPTAAIEVRREPALTEATRVSSGRHCLVRPLRSPRCVRWSTTKECRVTISRSRFNRKRESCLPTAATGSSAPARRSSKAGRCMPSSWPQTTAGTRATLPAASGNSVTPYSAPAVW